MRASPLPHILKGAGKLILGIGLCLSLTNTSAHAQDITTGLVGHWKLDELTGTTAAGSGPSSNDGTMRSGLSGTNSVAGKIGTALDFDGNDDDILAGSNIDYTSAMTWSAWIKPDTLADMAIMGDDDIFRPSFDLTSTGALFLSNSNADWLARSTGGHITAGDWAHVVVQWSSTASSSVSFFINGVNVPIGTDYGNTISTGSHGFKIGEDPTSNFDGAIDDVRIYDRILTAEDIAVLASGTAPGGVRYNNETEGLEYHSGYEWIHAGLGSYSANGVTFNGTNDYLTGTPFASDTKKMTGSFWIRTSSGGSQYIQSNNADRILVQSLGNIRISAKNSSLTTILSISTTANINDGEWHHVLYSFDLSDTSKRHLYVDGVSDLNVTTYTDDEISLAGFLNGVGAADNGVAKVDGDLADYWLDSGTYIDLSVAGNREKFRSATGMPMFLGTDGSIPLGRTPEIFLTGATDEWHTNKGTGGGFTENGTLTDAATQPNNAVWSQLGNDFNLSSNAFGRMTALDNTTIAYHRNGAGTLCTFSWDGTDWSQVGNCLGGLGANTSLSKLADNTIATTNSSGDIRTLFWDGTDWSQVGNTLAVPSSSNAMTTVLDSTTIAVMDSQNDELRTYSWDGTDWSQTGSGLTHNISGQNAIATLNSNTIVYSGGSNLQTFEWDGTNWSQVGNTLTTSFLGGSHPDLAVLSDHIVVLGMPDDDALQIFSWDGTDWTYKGQATTITGMGGVALTTLDGSARRIAYADDSNDDLRTYQFGLCSGPSYPQGSILYNTDDLVMQYCNGTDWVAMGPVGGTGGGGCANPAGNAGDLIFNEDHSVLQFCNSEDWVGIGRPDINVMPIAGLVGYWTLDETSGTTATDSSGYGNDGTWSGSVAVNSTSGKVATAFDLDGTDDGLNVGSDTSIDNIFDGGGTIAAWIYPHNAGEGDAGNIFANNSSPNGDGYNFRLSANGVIRLYVDTTGTGTGNPWRISSENSIIYNTWQHVAVTYDNSNNANNIHIYVNGSEVGYSDTNSGTGTVDDSAGNKSIGADTAQDGNNFDGAIDDVRLYNRILSASEIWNLYHASR